MQQPLWNGIFWHSLIYPELSSSEVEDPDQTVVWMLEKRMHSRFPDYVVCLTLDGYDELMPEDRSETLSTVRQQIHHSLPASQRQILGFAHGNAFYFCGTINLQSDRNLIIHQLELLHKDINRILSQPVTIGLAFLREPSLWSWRLAAQNAVVAQRRKVRSGGNCVYVVEEEIRNGTFDLALYWSLANRLHSLVRSGDVSRVGETLDGITNQIFVDTYLPLLHLRPILQCQIILMAQAAIEVGADAAVVASESERYLESLTATYDYAHMKDLIRAAAHFFTTAVNERYQCQSSRLIANAEEFIETHLDDPDLGLQQIANALDVNPSYLSRCYKKTQGIGIIEFINRLRVESAKRLLLDHKLSITEIAFQLGFGSVQHFGRVFRSFENTTPSDFRRQKIVQ